MADEPMPAAWNNLVAAAPLALLESLNMWSDQPADKLVGTSEASEP